MIRKSMTLATFAVMALWGAPAQGQDDNGTTVITVPGVESFVLSGQLRARAEGRDPVTPVVGANSTNFRNARARINLEAWVNDYVGAYLTLQESIVSQGAPSNDVLRQGYFQLANVLDHFSVQAGRFEMEYGQGRVVSTLDWDNVGRTWDGVRAGVDIPDTDLHFDLILTEPVQGQLTPNPDQDFFGIYGQWDAPDCDINVDAYVFKRRDPLATLDDYTIGALVTGRHDGFDWNAEGMYQTGNRGAGPNAPDVSAWAAAVELGYTFADAENLRIGVGADVASGDSDPTDTDSETFIPLFHDEHRHLGIQDIVVWSNLIDGHVSASLPVYEDWTVNGAFHYLMRHEKMDAFFTGLGAAGAVGIAGQDEIGTEIDVYVEGTLLDGLSLAGGVSFFAADDNGIVSADDQTWYWIQGLLNF